MTDAVGSLSDIPEGSVIGVNYSGMHDSAVAAVDPGGRLVAAVSLERLSRVKQDGRWPEEIVASVPWSKVRYVGMSVSRDYCPIPSDQSKFHDVELERRLDFDRSHESVFFEPLSSLRKDIVFVPHHLAHASSSFWASGFEEALCIVYDGGMSNEHWFGGVYAATRSSGLSEMDLFSAAGCGNVASLYAAVTAILGFRPLKHEGKLTGLAAHGKVDARVLDILQNWLAEPRTTHGLTHWFNLYGEELAPKLAVSPRIRQTLQEALAFASAQDIAATLQRLTETHVCSLVERALQAVGAKRNLCLSGGVFSNVKLNQRVSELGVDRLFIFPAMADDGTAAGAAWQALFERDGVAGQPIRHVFLGPPIGEEGEILARGGIVHSHPVDLERQVAERLAQGEIGAIARGQAEFGPRALGNRSILAVGRDKDVNASLNEKLSRTEFMPFAPVVREEDAGRFFTVSEAVLDCARYMTVTTPCSDEAEMECPAVVHVDGTARPQLVSAHSNPFLHRVLSEFASITGAGVLINTSFNIHEEPIVTSAEDALRSFFEAGLDFLVLGEFLILRSENIEAELAYLREQASESAKELRAARAEVERAAFDRLDDAALLLEKAASLEDLMKWVARKESSTLWKPFSWLANVEWDARNQFRSFLSALSPRATGAAPPPADDAAGAATPFAHALAKQRQPHE